MDVVKTLHGEDLFINRATLIQSLALRLTRPGGGPILIAQEIELQ